MPYATPVRFRQPSPPAKGPEEREGLARNPASQGKHTPGGRRAHSRARSRWIRMQEMPLVACPNKGSCDRRRGPYCRSSTRLADLTAAKPVAWPVRAFYAPPGMAAGAGLAEALTAGSGVGGFGVMVQLAPIAVRNANRMVATAKAMWAPTARTGRRRARGGSSPTRTADLPGTA